MKFRILASGMSLSRSFISSYKFPSKNSNTKYNSSFSLITSFNFTIFGWLNFFSDYNKEEKKGIKVNKTLFSLRLLHYLPWPPVIVNIPPTNKISFSFSLWPPNKTKLLLLLILFFFCLLLGFLIFVIHYAYHFSTGLVDSLQHTSISSISKLFRYLIPIHFEV